MIPAESQGKNTNKILMRNYDLSGMYEMEREYEEIRNMNDEDLERMEGELDAREAQQLRKIKEMEEEISKRRARWRRRVQLKYVRVTAREGVIERLRDKLERTREFAEPTKSQETRDPVEPTENESIDTTAEQQDAEPNEQPGDRSEEQTKNVEQPMEEETQETRTEEERKERKTQGTVLKPDQVWYWRKKGEKGRFVAKDGQGTENKIEIMTPEVRMLTQDPRIPFEIRRLYMRRLTRGGPGPAANSTGTSEEVTKSQGSGEAKKKWWQRPGIISSDEEEEETSESANKASDKRDSAG